MDPYSWPGEQALHTIEIVVDTGSLEANTFGEKLALERQKSFDLII